MKMNYLQTTKDLYTSRVTHVGLMMKVEERHGVEQ